jgi:hypothetical protein
MMAKWDVDCAALTKEPKSEDQDILVRLDTLYVGLVNVGLWGSEIDTVREAINEIVNLRIKLFVAQAPKMPEDGQ